MAMLLSVNVGLPRDVTWNGQTVHTGIWKEPVAGPVMARRLNLDGDGQGDLGGHGGEQRAVMVYQAQSYEHWRQHLDRSDLSWGIFGENFTVDGLPDDQVCIGDRYRIGEAEFEVTQPRVTCYRVGLRLGEPRMPALLVAHRRPGFYLRVLREGPVRAGDDIVQVGAAAERVSVAVTDAQLYLPRPDAATMRRLLTVGALSPGWQGSFRDLVERAATGRSRRGTASAPCGSRASSTRPTSSPRSTCARAHRSGCLRRCQGSTSPSGSPTPPTRARSATTPCPPPTADGYRISVKREPKGLASTYIATALAVGDQLDVAAPRGQFVLDDGAAPVVLLSAGIGVTPVLAMLEALAAQRSPREVWWLHTTRDPATHVLADEARRLLAALPAAHDHVFYTAQQRGRLDRAALVALGLPVDAQAYLCGPPGFMDAMTAALTDLGLQSDRIHTERFTSLTAINPGVVGAARPAPHAPAKPGSGPMVTFARAGLTVAFDESAASLLEMAEACDVPTRWSCRTGVCHTCSTPLLAGAVEYSPPPLTEPDDGEALLCCARPLSDVVLDL